MPRPPVGAGSWERWLAAFAARAYPNVAGVAPLRQNMLEVGQRNPLVTLLSMLFTWWNGPGLTTRIFTARHGVEVGRDDQGNIYYRKGSGRTERRWVIYNGEPEASRIPPEWHLWMHRTVKDPPSTKPLVTRVWERGWTPNATGSKLAHRPGGALIAGGKRAATTGDYRAWTPDA
jgi:NADH:ubiquinone oxidoreductase subunit